MPAATARAVAFGDVAQGTAPGEAHMDFENAKELFILGINAQGKAFRPSDWAERLAGVMGQFRPGGASLGSHIQYSPWCYPTSVAGVKCVIISGALRQAEPMAWDFVINFARDNGLQINEACTLPDAPKHGA